GHADSETGGHAHSEMTGHLPEMGGHAGLKYAVRVLKKSVTQFSEKFIGKELLSKLLCIDGVELSRRIESERVPTLNIPFGDGDDCYPLIPKIFIPRLASNF
ncbi:hypothetical protein, partial [Polynucleobacter sphagniphilus]|uniref:hypothetical protein n=1 Tax=Polynucleobacter sphagniphilus TaxID=1743169 RepID=UPI002476330F